LGSNTMKRIRKVEPVNRTMDTIAYPNDHEASHDCTDPSRRRFLRQVGMGIGTAGILTVLPLKGSAQDSEMVVDFSVLDGHPDVQSLNPAPPTAPMAVLPAQGEESREEQAGLMAPQAAPPTFAPTSPDGPSNPSNGSLAYNPTGTGTPATPSSTPSGSPPTESGVPEVIEDRSLWIDPGYIVLIRWTRPVDNTDVIAALEGSVPAVSSYLSTSITSRDELHEVERLHGHELAITNLLAPLIVPARILVLHLDHNCSTVCSRFPDFTETIPLPGMISPTQR
jgi:hypothetical protein